MKLKPVWIIDDYILESVSTVGDLKKAILDSKAKLYESKYVPFSDNQDYGPYTEKDCVILYGTHGFLRKCKIPFIPGAFGVNSNTSCNVYYSYIPNEWMLNKDYIMLPFSYIQNHTLNLFQKLNSERIFLRPNSGYKTFAGFVFDYENHKFELSSSQQLTSVMPETICLIAPAKQIDGEFRFIIGNGEVIDGSEYRWNNILDIRHDWPQECWDMADKVAKLSWQLDSVYTCDVAMTLDGPKIIELNSFSCAGLYACDKDIVVNRINEIAISEFYG